MLAAFAGTTYRPAAPDRRDRRLGPVTADRGRRQRWDSSRHSAPRDAACLTADHGWSVTTKGHTMSSTPSPAGARAAGAGWLSASSPRPSSWSSWTPRSSASRCPRCSTTSASPRRASAGSSTPTSSRSAACCCSAAGSPTCSAPAASSAIGWVVLAAGSLIAGLAGNVAVELAGRAVQGAGSALIAPAALTLLFMIFGATPKELTKALALYGAAAPAGGTAGVFLGGVLTEYASLAVGVLHQRPARRRRAGPDAVGDARRRDPPRLARRRRRRHRHRRARRRRVRRRPRPAGGLDLGLHAARRRSAAWRCSALFVVPAGAAAVSR